VSYESAHGVLDAKTNESPSKCFAIRYRGLVPGGAKTWELRDARFNDGGILTGFFVLDTEALQQLVDGYLKVSGGDTQQFPSFEYTKSNSGALLIPTESPLEFGVSIAITGIVFGL